MKQKNDIIKPGDIGENIKDFLIQPSTRREFLRKSTLATVALPMLGLLGLASKVSACDVCTGGCAGFDAGFNGPLKDCYGNVCQGNCGYGCGGLCSKDCTGGCTPNAPGGCSDCGHSSSGGGGCADNAYGGCPDCQGTCSRGCSSGANKVYSEIIGDANHISAWTVNGAGNNKWNFQSYAKATTPNNLIHFSSGSVFMKKLRASYRESGPIGDIYIYSHAWIYDSFDGKTREGGFYSNAPGSGNINWGLYGKLAKGDKTQYARIINDIVESIDNNMLKLKDNGVFYFVGCHLGEIGFFASKLAEITNRKIYCACGSVNHVAAFTKEIEDKGLFESRPAPETDEHIENDYDYWVRVYPSGNSDKLGNELRIFNAPTE